MYFIVNRVFLLYFTSTLYSTYYCIAGYMHNVKTIIAYTLFIALNFVKILTKLQVS